MKLGHNKTMRTRILSGAASVAVGASYLLPAMPFMTAAAAEAGTKTLPTAFAPPQIVSVYDYNDGADGHQAYDADFRLAYTTGEDYVDFLLTMEDSYFSDAEGNPDEYGDYRTNDYGTGYDYDFSPTIQVDFRVDGGEWHYDASWDENFYISWDSGWDSMTLGAYSYGEVGLFCGANSTEEDHFLSAYADCFYEQTDGSDVWYVFDDENHTLEFRARLFARVAHYELVDDEPTSTYTSIYSDWSEIAGYGAGYTYEMDVPTTLDAPVASNLKVAYEEESSGAPVMRFVATPSAAALTAIAAQEQYYGWVMLEYDVSFDGGETWFSAGSSDVNGQNSYEFSLYQPWLEYTNGEYETYAFAGGEVLLRSRYYYYLDAQLLNGLEYYGYEVYSDWSEPISITLDAKGVYTLSVTHQGTGYTGDGTLTHTVTDGAEIGLILCPAYEGCYVASVSVNGEVVYTYDDPEACTVLGWIDGAFYFEDPYMTENMDIVITYDGTPTEQVDIRISYTSDYGWVTPNGAEDTNNTEDGIFVGVDSVYIGSDVTYSFLPHDGCQIDRVLIDGVENEDARLAGEYTFTDVSENHTIAVEFSRYAVSVSWGSTANGTIYAEGYEDPDVKGTLVNIGESVVFVITPAVDEETGVSYVINEITVSSNGEALSLSDTYPELFAYVQETGKLRLDNLLVDTEVYVFFSTTTAKTVRINTSAGAGGSITESFDAAVDSDAYVYITPDEGYAIDTVTVDGVVVENFSGDCYIFTGVTEEHTISVTFKSVQTLESYNVTIINSGNASNNTVSPTGTQTVLEGAELTITYQAAEGYALEDILVNGTSIGADALAALDGTYTLENITADVTVEFVFSTTTCTVTFQDWNGEVLAEYSCEYGGGVLLVDVNTDALRETQDDGTIRFFSQWDTDYQTVYGDLIVTALYGTFKIESVDVTVVEQYSAKVGSVDVTFNQVMARVSLPTRQFDENGARIYQEDQRDVSADCVVTPSKLEEAFANGDSATVSYVYSGPLVPFDVPFGTLDITYTSAVLMGDIDGDGAVKTNDAVLALKAYAASILGDGTGLTEEQMYCADVNYDGKINTADAVYILKYTSIAMLYGSADWEAILGGSV